MAPGVRRLTVVADRRTPEPRTISLHLRISEAEWRALEARWQTLRREGKRMTKAAIVIRALRKDLGLESAQ